MSNRIIKFRGQRVDNDELVYGDLCTGENGTFAISTNSIGIFEVKPETVGQYTGLKDKNGKEIYEGDIVKVFEEDDIDGEEKNYLVEWGDKYPAFCLHDYEDLEYNSLQHAALVVSCEIIGNIYQSNELLNEKK